MVLQWICDYFR